MLKREILLVNFFARIEKLVVDCFLTLNFNLITLDFANNYYASTFTRDIRERFML